MAVIPADLSLPYSDQGRTEDEMRELLALFVPQSGVKYGELNSLAVYADGTGSMQVKVRSGKGVWAGNYGRFDTENIVTLDNPHATQNRVDLVIVRNNFTDNQVELDKLKGVEDGSNTFPTLTQNTVMYEQALARVLVGSAGAPYAIQAGDVVDMRRFTDELGPVCKAFRTTTQSINDATVTAAQLDNITSPSYRDTDGMHDPSGATPQRVDILKAGLYDVRGYIQFAANATGLRSVRLRVDNNDIEVEQTFPAASQQTSGIVSACLPLAAGNFVTVCGFQSSGGPLDISDAWLEVSYRQPDVTRT